MCDIKREKTQHKYLRILETMSFDEISPPKNQDHCGIGS